jgi:D-alanyl-D-alanine carboxypeptidase
MNNDATYALNSKPTLRRLGEAAIMATLAGGLLAAANTSDPVDQRAAALDKVIPPAMQRASIPGAIVGFWQDGHKPYVKAFGVSDTATGKPMTTDLYTYIGSNSKAFIATVILMLADQGKLDLGDSIDRYVKGVPNGNQITLRQLAQMRSGLYNYADYLKLWEQPRRQYTPQELLALAFRHPVLFPPGTKFDYCNTNTVLLGLVVEKVSGQSLGTYIMEKILKPEGLSHTVFPTNNEFPAPHTHGYFKTPDGKILDATDWNISWGWAAGNMISTLDDMRVWARVLATGKLISPAMKAEQQQFLPAPEEGDGALYGLALENQNGWIGHNGNTQSYMAYPYYLPDEKVTMVVLTNSGVDIPDTWRMMQAIAPIVSPSHPWTGLPKE